MDRRLSYNLIAIGVLVFIVFNLVFPRYINQGIDYLNSNLKIVKVPSFPERQFKLGLDLQGGSHLVYEADLAQIKSDNKNEAMQGLRNVIERRVNLFGVSEPIVAVQKSGDSYRLTVDLPGVKDVNQAIEMIGKTPLLEFKEERAQQEIDAILAKQKEVEGKTQEEVDKIANWQLAMEDPYFQPTNLNGQYLKKAEVGFSQTGFEPEVLLEFNADGAKLFKDITSANIGKRIAIYVDGSLLSAPKVNEEIPDGKARITGTFTKKEAQDLVRNLNAGALPVPIKLISQTTIEPTLGAISLNKSLTAGMYGFLAVAVFMILTYRFPGLIAGVVLMIYAGIMLVLFKFVPVTLTLAGIGGAILSVGMAVDANVLIFARMKEERKAGENFIKALEIGFSRAWPSIRDSNVTTLLVAFVMFGFGTSFVKGFALTLSLGVLVSMFSALFVTKNFLRVFAGTRWEKIKWLWN